MIRAVAFFVIVTAVSVAAGIGWSYYYWHYPIAPPLLLPELASLSSVQKISAVQQLHSKSRNKIEIEPLDEKVLQSPSSWFLDPTWRLPLKLEYDGIALGDCKPVSAHFANAFWLAANDSGLLFDGTSGYPDTKTLYGHIGVGRLIDGSEVAFAPVAGNEYSNDHYPYYEFVARLEKGEPIIINSQWYYFDVAGIEGLNWVVVTVLSFIVLVPIAGIPALYFAPGGAADR